MKKFIQLLLKKRFKILKSKRGFSLIEVLVAVAIIGIISAIAVPQFVAQRENAARVAADTSATNIVKAFRQCRVLKPFGSCNTLGLIDMTCPSGATCGDEDANPKFCAHIKNGDSVNPDFAVCVSVNGSSESRTYGGSLLQNNNICHYTQVDDGNSPTCTDTAEKPVSPITLCTGTGVGTCGSAGTVSAGCTISARACKPATTVGECNGTADCT